MSELKIHLVEINGVWPSEVDDNVFIEATVYFKGYNEAASNKPVECSCWLHKGNPPCVNESRWPVQVDGARIIDILSQDGPVEKPFHNLVEYFPNLCYAVGNYAYEMIRETYTAMEAGVDSVER